jgi:hypothetical protein
MNDCSATDALNQLRGLMEDLPSRADLPWYLIEAQLRRLPLPVE